MRGLSLLVLACARYSRALTMSAGSKPKLVLHCKAGPDGQSYGDCPFAHAVRLALEVKDLEYSLAPHGPNNKPDWLVANHGGSMPALEIIGDNDSQTDVLTESREIVSEICKRFRPHGSLSPPGLAAAEEAAAPLFGAFARYTKNTEVEADSELKKALLLSLCKLDAHLASPGEWAAGSEMSAADCFLLPKLYHVRTAGAHFKDFEIPANFEALQEYMRNGFESQMLYRTAPPPPMVRWGWANARGDAAQVELAASELQDA